jgi:hypothetical protein
VVLWATAFTAASDADGCEAVEAPAPGTNAAEAVSAAAVVQAKRSMRNRIDVILSL